MRRPRTLPDVPVPATRRRAVPTLRGRSYDSLAAAGEVPWVEVLHPDDDECVVTFLRHAPRAGQVHVQVNRVTHTPQESAMDQDVATGWWHASFLLPREWRGSYSFLEVEPGAHGIGGAEPREVMRRLRLDGSRDVHNPRREVTPAGPEMSWAEADRAPAPDWLDPDAAPGHPNGMPRPVPARTPGGRRVWVHEPAPDGGGPRALVVVLDGPVWLASGAALRQIRALATAGVVREPVVVFVDPGDADQRWDEMSVDGAACDVVAEDVVPWARERLGAGLRAEEVVLTGESLGGLTAVRTVLERPDQVGAALSQSASTWQDSLLGRAEASSRGRFFLTAGQFEGSLFPGHLALVERFGRDGRLVGHREYAGGHDMACWRAHWGEGLAALLPRLGPAAA